MIYTFMPYCPYNEKNIGLAYNLYMRNISDNDWACFIDHDAMPTTEEWYKQLEEITHTNPNIGILTCVTNRIGNEEQLAFPKDSPEAQNHDIYFHRKIGKDILYASGNQIREARNLISGVLLLTNKKAWRRAGGFKDGFLGVDNDYDKKLRNLGYTTYIADGLYLYHWYRAAPNGSDNLPYNYSEKTFLPPI